MWYIQKYKLLFKLCNVIPTQKFVLAIVDINVVFCIKLQSVIDSSSKKCRYNFEL